MPSFDPNRLKQVRKSQISANYSVEHAINKIYGFDFLAVNDLCVYLRGLDNTFAGTTIIIIFAPT